MSKRTKKPPVANELRSEWLKRNEQGESPPKIADADGFDVRTVRKHLELARLERDVQQARSDVLRKALEDHYNDLLETVRNIEKLVSNKQPVSMEKEQPLVFGLRQHMPRSPLWENLRKWNRKLSELNESLSLLREKIHQEVISDGRLSGIISEDADDVVTTAVNVLFQQAKSWARGWQALDIENNIHVEKTSEGRVNMRYGPHSFGIIEERYVEAIKNIIADFESRLKQYPEYMEVEKIYIRLGQLVSTIKDLLTTIQLRRIVPGKCKYCPL
jgi:hypothetical protein